MLFVEAIKRWSEVDGDVWFIDALPEITKDLHHLKNLEAFEQFQLALWELCDNLNQSAWSDSSSFAMVELGMDAALILGDEGSFRTFFSWMSLRSEQLHRHQAAMDFMKALGRTEDLREAMPRVMSQMDLAIEDEEDNRWNSLSLVAMVDLAQRHLPLSAELPHILEQDMRVRYDICEVDWFLDDLVKLNPNSLGWLDARNKILGPIYSSFLGDIEFDSSVHDGLGIIDWNEHLDVFDFLGKTKSVYEIVEEAKNEYREMANRDDVWKSLKRGIAIITEKNQLDAYLASYGGKHLSKLNHIWKHSGADNPPIRIVDWSCGQGIGTLTLLESEWVTEGVEEIILVDPSKLALKRAELLIRNHSQCRGKAGVTVRGFSGLLESKTLGAVSFTGSTLHIFSNVLDIDAVDLNQVRQMVVQKFSGPQHFVAVSPFASRARALRLLSFRQLFSQETGFKSHMDIEHDTLGESNASITARTFSCHLD